jgi:predicted DNA-binding transcriptional regulator YafY
MDDSLRGALRGAVAKLESTLDRPVQRRTRDLLARTRFVAQEERGPALTGAVLRALRERRTLRLAYRDTRTGVRTRRVVEPLGLVCLGEAWWLLAYCHLREGARIFRLDRIASCEDTGETFEPREGFSFAEVLRRDRELGRAILGC